MLLKSLCVLFAGLHIMCDDDSLDVKKSNQTEYAAEQEDEASGDVFIVP